MIIPVVLTGRCANGNERRGDRVVHAIEVAADHKYDDAYQGAAICGATSEAQSAGFSELDKETRITCQRCVKRINKKAGIP